jgi:hypothetical protein
MSTRGQPVGAGMDSLQNEVCFDRHDIVHSSKFARFALRGRYPYKVRSGLLVALTLNSHSLLSQTEPDLFERLAGLIGGPPREDHDI